MSSHTPGPWFVYCDGSWDLHWWGGEYGDHTDAYVVTKKDDDRTDKYICCLEATGPDKVYKVGSEEIPIPIATDENRANIHLIAAAPELLKELRLMVLACRCGTHDEGDPMSGGCHRCVKAQDVIRKAEGK